MQGLILAGGEGRRLALDGIAMPKALVPLGGEPQLLRLARQFVDLGCPEVTVMLRKGIPVPVELTRLESVRIHWCETSGSLDTLVLGLELAPRGTIFCSMVDTVMAKSDWHRVFGVATSGLASGADAVLAITPAEEDDSPLAVRFGRGGRIASFEDSLFEPGCWVTGGVYAFADAIRVRARESVATGCHRMRDMLRHLLASGGRLETVDVARLIDLDRRRNLGQAEALVASDPLI